MMKTILGCILVLTFHVSMAQKPLESRPPSYIMDTARPAADIQDTYPFDIRLISGQGDTLGSEAVFPALTKPVVLLFWLTTCYPCRMELEALKKSVPEWQQSVDFELIAISTDFAKNLPAFYSRVEEGAWPWLAYNDYNREFSKIMPGGLNGLPQTFVIGKDGEILYHKRKFRPGDEAEIWEAIQAAAKKY